MNESIPSNVLADLEAQYASQEVSNNADISPDVLADLEAQHAATENASRGTSITDYLKGAARSGADFVTGAGRGLVLPFAQAADLVMPQAYLDRYGRAAPQVTQAPDNAAGITGEIAGGIAPFGAAARLGMSGLNALSRTGVPGGASLISQNTGANIARLAAGSAAYEAMMQPENRLRGAALGGIAGGAAAGIMPAINALRPSRWFKEGISPEKLSANLEAARNSNTSLAQVVESPSLNFIDNAIAKKIPFSGSDKLSRKQAQQVADKGEGLISKLQGSGNSKTYTQNIKEALISSSRDAQQQSTRNFEDANSVLDELGINIGSENYAKEAGNILVDLKSSPRLFATAQKKTPGLIDDLEEAATTQTSDKLKGTGIFRGLLGEEKSNYSKEGKKFAAAVYNRLIKATDSDIEDAFSKDPSGIAKQKYDYAQNFYRENVVPFEDPAITKFTRKGGDADTLIGSFVKKGGQDRSILLEKLLSKLPDEEKGLVGYGYLSPSIQRGEVNPFVVKDLYKSLGDNTKESLFSPSIGNEAMKNYSRSVEMNAKPLSRMFHPETGRIGADFIPAAAIASLGLGTRSLLGTAAVVSGAAVAARVFNRLNTSERLRERLVNSMLNKKDWTMKIENDYINASLDVPVVSALLSSINQGNQGQ